MYTKRLKDIRSKPFEFNINLILFAVLTTNFLGNLTVFIAMLLGLFILVIRCYTFLDNFKKYKQNNSNNF